MGRAEVMREEQCSCKVALGELPHPIFHVRTQWEGCEPGGVSPKHNHKLDLGLPSSPVRSKFMLFISQLVGSILLYCPKKKKKKLRQPLKYQVSYVFCNLIFSLTIYCKSSSKSIYKATSLVFTVTECSLRRYHNSFIHSVIIIVHSGVPLLF